MFCVSCRTISGVLRSVHTLPDLPRLHDLGMDFEGVVPV